MRFTVNLFQAKSILGRMLLLLIGTLELVLAALCWERATYKLLWILIALVMGISINGVFLILFFRSTLGKAQKQLMSLL